MRPLNKGELAGKICKGYGGFNRRPQGIWEASGQRGETETPFRKEWRFVRSGGIFLSHS
jgi:hypothetical protein